jgi:hypothetical protein
MTYQDDPNLNRLRAQSDTSSNAGWIIGGLVVLAVIIGLFIAFGNTGTNTSPTASNRMSPPATTGSGMTAPSTTPSAPSSPSASNAPSR